MIDVLWINAVSAPEYQKGRDGSSKKVPMGSGGLASWDQGPINSRVLRGGRHPYDPSLVLIDRPLPVPGDAYAALDRRGKSLRLRLAFGVLPMLQFATAYTYYIQRGLRDSVGARPYSLHAIYSHGHDDLRKQALLREALGWHDAPSYYGHLAGPEDADSASSSFPLLGSPSAASASPAPRPRRGGRRSLYLTYDSAPPERAVHARASSKPRDALASVTPLLA